MPYQARRVASLYKRADYKTEFDIFKQNTELDLISLVSIEDDPKEQDFINRRCYSSRPAVKSTQQTHISYNSYSRCASARYPTKTGINTASKTRANVRTCKSAVSRFDGANYNNRIKTSNYTTPRYKRNTSSDQSSLNKDKRTYVDIRCAKYTSTVQSFHRQVKSVYAQSQPRVEYIPNRRYDSINRTDIQPVTNRVNSASSQSRPATSTCRKPSKVCFLDEKESITRESGKTGDKESIIDCDEEPAQVYNDVNVKEKNKLKCETRGSSVDSVDSGVIKDLSVRLSIDTDPFETETTNKNNVKESVCDTDNQDDDDVSCCSVDGSDISDDQDSDSDECFGLHDFINGLVDRDGVRSRLENSIKDNISETDSLFSICSNEDEHGENKERIKETFVEESNTKQVQEPQDITMSKEAKSIIIETLHDLKDKKIKGCDKENLDDNIRYKSVRKQKRMKENRSKYDFFMRERTESYIQLTSRRREDRDRESDYEKNNDLYESEDEALPSLDANNRNKFFPSISSTNKRGSQTCSSASASSKNFYSLEQVKKRKYKIPGIGNYNFVSSPDYDFEVTPPGFDCRYDARPILTKEELDPPPKCIQERSIQKCKKWLKNVNLSPLNLNPVINKKQ